MAFNVARFGQSDPKKFPKTPQKFWAFPWDEGQEKSDDPMAQYRKNQEALKAALEKRYGPGASMEALLND